MTQQPKRERLSDVELGIERTYKQTNWGATLYYMNYKDQLVLTGKINDVGAYTRTNIPKSYRMGVELQGGARIISWLNISANLALSQNKVIDFTEYIDDYGTFVQTVNEYHKTDIAFSPGVVGAASFNFLPCPHVELSLLSKYVGKEYLDNTQNEGRKLDPFYVQDVRAIYTINTRWLKEIKIIGQVNNVFNGKYEPNGYTFSYIPDRSTTITTENYYFPMAGVNFMIAVNVRL
jgi:iron complex outermembrane receptor protein